MDILKLMPSPSLSLFQCRRSRTTEVDSFIFLNSGVRSVLGTTTMLSSGMITLLTHINAFKGLCLTLAFLELSLEGIVSQILGWLHFSHTVLSNIKYATELCQCWRGNVPIVWWLYRYLCLLEFFCWCLWLLVRSFESYSVMINSLQPYLKTSFETTMMKLSGIKYLS